MILRRGWVDAHLVDRFKTFAPLSVIWPSLRAYRTICLTAVMIAASSLAVPQQLINSIARCKSNNTEQVEFNPRENDFPAAAAAPGMQRSVECRPTEASGEAREIRECRDRRGARKI